MIRSLLLIVLLIGMASPAAADRKAARRAFDEGSALFEDGRYREAAEKFRLAYAEQPTWKLLYNIAQCEAGAKNYGLALEAFEQYIIEAGDEIAEQRLVEVQTEIARLKPMVGFLKISGPTGATVSVDGLVRGTLPMNGVIPVSAARDHVIEGKSGQTELIPQTVRLLTGQTFSITLGTEDSAQLPMTSQPDTNTDSSRATADAGGEAGEVVEASDAQTGSAQPAPSSGAAAPARPIRKAGIALLISGGVVLAGGFGLGGAGFLKAASLDEANPDGVSGDDAKARDSYKNMAMAGDILMGVGGAAAISGIIVLLVNRKRNHESLQTRVMPQMASDGAGVVWEGRF